MNLSPSINRSRSEDSAKSATPPPALRILLVDDHAVVRDGLKQILLRHFSAASFGEARDAAEALECVNRQNWDVILLDLSLPGQSGLQLLKQLTQLQPRARILVLTMHPEDQYAIPVLKAGAAGYLTKESASAEVITALQKVLAGGKYVSASLAQELVAAIGQPAPKQPHEFLSERELDVFRALARGASLTQIAQQLSLSVKTVSTYRSRSLEKTGLKTNAEIVRYALRAKLIE